MKRPNICCRSVKNGEEKLWLMTSEANFHPTTKRRACTHDTITCLGCHHTLQQLNGNRYACLVALLDVSAISEQSVTVKYRPTYSISLRDGTPVCHPPLPPCQPLPPLLPPPLHSGHTSSSVQNSTPKHPERDIHHDMTAFTSCAPYKIAMLKGPQT